MPRSHDEDPTKTEILNILDSMGKRTMFRYLRDHKLLEKFTEQLPGKNFEDASEPMVRKTLIRTWDDYSPKKLEALRDWRASSVESGLGIRMALYASDLHKEGHTPAAIEVLKMATQVDSTVSLDKVKSTAGNIKTGDTLFGINGTVGFGKQGAAGQVTNVSRVDDTIHIAVHCAQVGQSYTVTASPADKVTLLKTKRPRFSRALKMGAIAKLLAVESRTKDIALQARVSRVRLLLEQDLENES